MLFKVVGYGGRGWVFLLAVREASGNLEAGSVLALGGGGPFDRSFQKLGEKEVSVGLRV
jgi:hypothetical protein